MDIYIETIPHEDQYYPTSGDYEWDSDMRITVSRLGNEKFEFLVAIHELIEAFLCKTRGIKEADITAFDMQHLEDSEPGARDDAPYHKEHIFAEDVELLLADQLGVNWDEYEDAIGNLFAQPQKEEKL